MQPILADDAFAKTLRLRHDAEGFISGGSGRAAFWCSGRGSTCCWTSVSFRLADDEVRRYGQAA